MQSTETALSLPLDQLTERIKALGGKPFHARIVREQVFQHKAVSYDSMTSLPKALREALKTTLPLFATKVKLVNDSSDGTRKFLIDTPEGNTVESVLIPYRDKKTACISTQVGCAMGCKFCASTQEGLIRDLKAHEIVEQFLWMNATLTGDERIDKVVVMGMGEPLANYAQLKTALETLNAPDCIGLGARKITVSTVGLPAAIRKFADEIPSQFNLAISLHAPNDELRTQIIPTNRQTGIRDILAAAQHYFDKTGRELTFEYILLKDVNSTRAHAHELGRRLQGLRCVVNLIPMNPVAGSPFQPPTARQVKDFEEILFREYHIPCHTRQRKGDDINAACGQLRRSVAGAAGARQASS